MTACATQINCTRKDLLEEARRQNSTVTIVAVTLVHNELLCTPAAARMHDHCHSRDHAAYSVHHVRHAWGSARRRLKRIPAFREVGQFGLPVHFVASPELHGRFKCCSDSNSSSAILSTCTTRSYVCLSQPLASLSCSVHIALQHSLSCHSYRTPCFPYAFLIALCPFWHICTF
jgi:hypothetical protein